MSIKTDERFLSLLGWALEKRRMATIAQCENGGKFARKYAEEEEKYLNKLFEYIDSNYSINKKSVWVRLSWWSNKDKKC